MKDKAPQSSKTILHQKAEELLSNKLPSPDLQHHDIATLKLIHELEVHQIELEMQNDELLLAKNQAEIAVDKFTDLYDFAPSGYFTLSREGEIMEVNFSGAIMLDRERLFLYKSRFGFFVSDDTKTIFNTFLDNIFIGRHKETCELTLVIDKKKLTHVYISGIVSESEEQCFITVLDISERKKAEEIIRISEEKYHSLFDANKDSITIFRVSPDGKPMDYLEVNIATTDIFGYTRKELLSMNLAKLEMLSDKKRRIRFETIQVQGKADFESIIKNKKGNKRNIEVESVLINFGNEPAIMNITRDITERKQMENNVKKANENLSTILEAIPDLLFEVDMEGRIHHYHSHHADVLAAPASAYMGKLFHEVLPIDAANICMEAIQEAAKKGWSTGKQYELKVPQGKQSFEISVSPIEESNDKERHFILLSRDITERRQAEDALLKEEEKLRGIYNLANSGIVMTDNKGKFLLFNNWWTEMLGYTMEEMNSLTNLDITFPDDVENSQIWFNKIIEGKIERYQVEKRYVKKDKSIFWAELSVSAIKDKNSKVVNTIGVITDINEHKKTEEALKETNSYLENLINYANAPIIVWDQKFHITRFNHAFEKLTGLKESEVIGQSLKLLFPKEQIENSMVQIRKTASGERWENLEIQIVNRDKSIKTVLWNSSTLFAKDGVTPISTIAQGQEITKRKLAEETLRESEEKYRGLVENSPNAIAIYVDGKIVFVNNECVRLTAATNKEDLIGKPILQFVHPDSCVNVIRMLKEIMVEGNPLPTSEEKFIRMDGTTIYVEIKAMPTMYEHKTAIQLIVQDISKRKQFSIELEKINRVYALISQINNLILRSNNREELFHEICRIAVTYGKFRMSWIGLLDEDTKLINTAAFDGFEDGYFTKDEAITILDEPGGRGPTGTAMREGRTIVCNDIATDPQMAKWRNAAIKRGYHSSISIPIMVRNKILASFNLYSEETNAFSSSEEVALLEKITENIAFTLESILIEEDRKHTEEKIRQLSQAVEQSPVSIVITNIAGDIEYANPKFSESTGYALDEVIGQNPRILKSGHTSPEEYKELWQTLASNKEWHGEFHNKRKNGELYWESASISPILNSQGTTTHYIAIKEDITHRKKVEQELVKAKEQAEESDRLKLAFLANMSHEIRTPMNGILGFTELLKAPHLADEEQQEYIRIIEKSGARMLNIINDIINISKVESGQMEVILSDTNINEQLEYLYTFFKPQALQKGIQLSITNHLQSNESILKTDSEKVYAILTNIVKNAIKFTYEGSVEFGCIKKGKFMEFFVKDTGAGISKSKQKIVFERFRQVNESLTRTHEGSGLGLAISKAYVEILGGKIWVESEEGKGSTFYFTLPVSIEPQSEEKTTVAKTAAEVKVENKIKDLKILIVEDDEISKLLITIAVKPYSKEILKASTGIDAIETCRNNPDIDLVMMDINMPIMGGYEATKQIRKFNKKVVIIAQTANAMSTDRDNAIASGCNDYIAKPVNITSLNELIQKYFKE